MSYIYVLKDGYDLEKLKEIGFDYMPSDIVGKENEKIIYKIVEQPIDGECVNELIKFYNKIALKICTDKIAKKAHEAMGIKFTKRKNTYKLYVTDELLEMFSLWRIEINLEIGELYFTISDGNMPSFYDAELVLDKYCKDEIDLLIANNLIEKVESTQIQ